MALSAPRNTPAETLLSPLPVKLQLPVKDTYRIFPGALVVLDGGYARPGAAATGLVAVGRASNLADNRTTVSGHADGFVTVDVEQGVFRWANSGGGDAIAQAQVGLDCYVVDDQTVAKTSNGGTRSPAGKIVGVDSSGVYVDMFIGVATENAEDADISAAQADIATLQTQPFGVIAVPVKLANSANAAVAARITPGFAGRIIGTSFQVTDPTTTDSKAGTLSFKIGATGVTGGDVALASNTDTGTLGKTTAGAAVTAANVFDDNDEITAVWGSVTAFAEGEGVLFVHLG